MKINPKITEKVDESVAECRKVLVDSTIELLRLIGKNGYEEVVFDKILFLFQARNNISETILADRIEYNMARNVDYYFVTMGSKMTHSSNELSLSNLQIIYEEVRKIVRKH